MSDEPRTAWGVGVSGCPDGVASPGRERWNHELAESRRVNEELRRVNEELRRRVDELETLFELAPVGLGISRDPDCRHIEPNPTFRRMLRLPIDANASKSAPENERPPFRVLRTDGTEIPPDELPMQVVARTGIPINGSECHLVFDGDDTVIDLLGCSAPLFDENDRPRGCIGAFLDITDHKRMAAELREARAAAENANQAKDRFLAVLSHELRGPLTPIMVVTSLWQEHKGEKLPEGFQEDLKSLQRSVRLQARLIDDLLDLSRIVSGKLVVRPQSLDLHELLQHCLDAHRAQCDAKGLSVSFHPRAARKHINGDSARLEQVFGNLLRNAIKFTPQGTIEITTEDFNGEAGGAGGDNSMVRVRVRDSGVGLADGVPPEAHFQPFEQGDPDRGRQYGGLGLGLSICRGFVTAHGGRISAASDGPDKGTTITVDLPVGQPQA